MKVIGITGGVGAGKSKILSYIEEHCSCRIIRADEAAHVLEQPGQDCYKALVELLGDDILQENGEIQKNIMAEKIFSDETLLQRVNDIIHPAVKLYICEQIATERSMGRVDFFFIEAALLIEEHYEKIVDELWYIHTDTQIRAARLAESRNYSSEKIHNIMAKQLSEEEFRKHCQMVIVNNGDLEETYRQIDEALKNR